MKAFVFMPMLAMAAMAATIGETDRFIPLVQDGGGWTTEITLVNLLRKPATVSVTFLNDKGMNDLWKLSIKASVGKVFPNGAEIGMAPGASVTISTGGESTTMSRGFADIVEFQDQLVAGFATLIRREAGVVVERLHVPLTPANERRSTVLLDFSQGETLQMVWVTLTTSTTLDVLFRNAAGETVFTDVVRVDDSAQKVVDLLETWPKLAGFKGSLEWTVSFPNADRYENRTLAGIALHRAQESGRLTGVSQGMTLRADQSSTSPY